MRFRKAEGIRANTRRLAQMSGALVVVWAMTAGPAAQAAQEAGGRVDTSVRTAGPAAGGVTPDEIMAAVSAALEEAGEEQAKRDRAELEERFAVVRARIAALPSRNCRLSVRWNQYTDRFAAILARVDDAPDPLPAAERAHAMDGLNELDGLVNSAMRYDADVCADEQELAALRREARRRRADARSRLGRVAAAVVCPTTPDRAALTAIVHRHRPADERVRAIYDEAAVDLVDEIGLLERSGALCRTAATGSLVKRLPGMVVDRYVPYRDPVGVKTVENAGMRALMQGWLDARGRGWLETFTVPPADAGGHAGAGRE